MNVWALSEEDQVQHEKSHDITVLVRTDDGQLYGLQAGQNREF